MTTLIPSYGRDYKSGKAAREAFLAGFDFTVANAFSREDGRQCSIADFKAGDTVLLRFKRLTGVTSVKVTKIAQTGAALCVQGRLNAKPEGEDCTCAGASFEDCPVCGC